MRVEVFTKREVDEDGRARLKASVEKYREDQSYGICVKICPVRRCCSQPPRIQRTSNHVIMEEPDLETSTAGDVESLPDSALGNSRSLKSDEAGSGFSSLNETSETVANLTSDCQTSSANIHLKSDLFDLLVLHFFGPKKSDRRESKDKLLKSSTISGSDRNRPSRTSLRRRTSTPESRWIKSERSSNAALSLGVSRIRALGASNLRHPQVLQEKREKYKRSQSVVATLKSRYPRAVPSATNCSTFPKRVTADPKSNSARKSRRSVSVHMPLSGARRPDSQAITSERRHERSRQHGPRPDQPAKSGDGRNTLDRVTAGSISHRRVKRTNDKFGEIIRSATQLSNMHPRTRSASGIESRAYPRRDLGEWRSPKENEATTNLNVAAYGRASGQSWKLVHRRSSPSAADSAEMDSVGSSGSGLGGSANADLGSFASHSVGHETESEMCAQPSVNLTSNEERSSVMKRTASGEDLFTAKLISAMTELKEITRMARNIDEEDNEEWLSVFIEDLDYRLRHLMKLEDGFCVDGEHLSQKVAVSDVFHNLISFLKDRLSHRAFEMDVETDRDSSAQRGGSHGPYEMRKWQRHLVNLVNTLDRYVGVLQGEKEVPRSRSRLGDYVANPQPSDEKKDVDDVLSELRRSIEARRHSSNQSNSRALSITSYPPNGPGDAGNTNFNLNSNGSQNGKNIVTSSQSIRVLPVLDRRGSRKTTASDVSHRVDLAAFVPESGNVDGRDRADDGFLGRSTVDALSRHDEVRSPLSGSPRASAPLANTVTSAYCRFPNNSDGAKLKKNLQKTEFRMVVGGATVADRQTFIGSHKQSVNASLTRSSLCDTPPSGEPPKVLSRSQSSAGSSGQSEVLSPNFNSGLRHQRTPPTSSTSTQCDLGARLRQEKRSGDEKLNQMKRRVDLLEADLDETRQERDDYGGKIGVLLSQLERIRTVDVRDGDMGMLEDEIDGSNISPKDKTIESAKKSPSDLEKRKRYQRMTGKNSDGLSKRTEEQPYLVEETEGMKHGLHDRVVELESFLESAGKEIYQLKKDNNKLGSENRELAEALSNEQMISRDLARCFMEQVEYLNLELKVSETRTRTQKEQYEKEISRLLLEGGRPTDRLFRHAGTTESLFK